MWQASRSFLASLTAETHHAFECCPLPLSLWSSRDVCVGGGESVQGRGPDVEHLKCDKSKFGRETGGQAKILLHKQRAEESLDARFTGTL